MSLKGISHAEFGHRGQLRLQLRRHIGHQLQLVAHLKLLVVVAVRQIVINDGASRHQPAG